MTRVVTALAVSADGFIAGPNDRPGNPLGDGGGRLFEWYTDGDTQSKFFPNFKLSRESAKVFDDGAANVGAIISGRRTYEISNAWGGGGRCRGYLCSCSRITRRAIHLIRTRPTRSSPAESRMQSTWRSRQPAMRRSLHSWVQRPCVRR